MYMYMVSVRGRACTLKGSTESVGPFHETVCMKILNLVFRNKSQKYFKMLSIFFFDCTTGMCNYYFCKHLMKYCRGESYNHTVSLGELDCIPDNLLAASQMIGTCTLHVAHLYWGADSPVGRINDILHLIMLREPLYYLSCTFSC